MEDNIQEMCERGLGVAERRERQSRGEACGG